MSDLAQLHFLRPAWAWALLMLPALMWMWRARRKRDSVWRTAVDPHLLPHLLDARGDRRGSATVWFGALAFVVAVAALAGPTWRKINQPLLQGQAPLVIALDLSSAALAGDLPPSRLLQARAKIAALLAQRAGGEVGLVAYADDAFTVAPLTDDAGNVALFLDALAPDVMPVDGSRGERAIDWSAKLLQRAGFEHGDIVLFTDHADAAARSAAATASRQGFRVSAIGLGTVQGAAYQKGDGGIAQTRLDADSLRALAQAGQGDYRGLAPDASDIDALGLLDPARGAATTAHGATTNVWQDGGYWLLLPLMLLALFAFRRGGALAALLLCAWLPWQPVHAADRNGVQGDWWHRPDQAQHARMTQGAEAYRKGDFASAQGAWQALDGADAAYNAGNALAKAERYEDAIAAYDKALRAQPGMADAIANKRAVEAALKRKPPSGPKDHRGDQKQQPQQGKPKPGEQGAPNDADGKPQPNQHPPGQSQPSDRSRDGQPNQPQPDQPQPSKDQASADAQTQRDADAAQRARMQRAIDQARQAQQQAQDGKKIAGKPQRAESAAEREKRQANEAWLRRVPDDPGGLLRAKFRLEYERRAQSGGS
ncbi:MAG: VWA domain-containing protein [Luteimonas sp.]